MTGFRKILTRLLILCGIIVVGKSWMDRNGSGRSSIRMDTATAVAEVTAKDAALRDRVAQLQLTTAEAVENYRPPADARIDDLASDVTDILRLLPGVASVDASQADKPTSRIIHLLDWYFPRHENYVSESLQVFPPSTEEKEAWREVFWLEAELAQFEQVALLRCLIRHHGVKRVFVEGLTEENAAEYRQTIASLRRLETELPEIQEQQRAVGQQIQKIQESGGDASAQSAQQQETQTQIDEIVRERRLNLLRVGAIGRLVVTGEIEDVHPLDKEQSDADDDARVRSLLDQGPVSFIVLDGDHNLTESIQRLSEGRSEYVRISTKTWKEFGERDPH